MVSNGSSQGPTGGFHRGFGRRLERRNNGRSKTAFSVANRSPPGPLLAVRKETRSEVDCAGVDIAKNYPTRLVFRLVLPFRFSALHTHVCLYTVADKSIKGKRNFLKIGPNQSHWITHVI